MREDRAERPDLAITIVGYQYGWRYIGGATSISGEGYERMAFEMRILPPDAYEAWQKNALIRCAVS